MAEIGIGVLFAVWFVLAYLFIAKLVAPRKQRIAVWRHWTQPNFDATQLADGKKPQLFLTTEALSQHHSRTANRTGTGEPRSSSGTER